ncbi:MAG: hypothetical protein M3Z24_02900 [Chloroflexota bacterium]|nr:hypothetical protein [Chloroflexota bacterium]
MGVERSVTRWYLQRQTLLDEIATLEVQLSQSHQKGQETRPVVTDTDAVQKLARARSKLLMLGPCPKPMMG